MPARVTVKSHGSIRVEGDFELYDINGNKFELKGRTRISLCRCGKSSDMPFCDSTHKKVGFTSEIVARELPPQAEKQP